VYLDEPRTASRAKYHGCHERITHCFQKRRVVEQWSDTNVALQRLGSLPVVEEQLLHGALHGAVSVFSMIDVPSFGVGERMAFARRLVDHDVRLRRRPASRQQLKVHVVLDGQSTPTRRGPPATVHRLNVRVCKVAQGNGLPVQLHVALLRMTLHRIPYFSVVQSCPLVRSSAIKVSPFFIHCQLRRLRPHHHPDPRGSAIRGVPARSALPDKDYDPSLINLVPALQAAAIQTGLPFSDRTFSPR
jgi:hypothetical protein